MIKFFKNQDIITSKFSVSKVKTVNTIFHDLLEFNDENGSFIVSMLDLKCDNIHAGSCLEISSSTGYLSISQFDAIDCPTYEVGKYIPTSSVFYPIDSIYYNTSQNPINSNGSYQGQIYNTIKNMYYNDYNNAYNIFGFDGYNTTNTDLNLFDKFSLYSFSVIQSGDTIKPKSVKINNQSGDLVGMIYDDGNNNLYLSASCFVNNFMFSTDNTDTVINYGETGVSKCISS